DLLLGLPPRIKGELLERKPGEDLTAYACRISLVLDHSVLPIQGPPGAGKTCTAARMICALVAAGKKVGITAVSHKVIRHLLDKVEVAKAEIGVALSSVQKVGATSPVTGPIEEVDTKAKILDRLQGGSAQVAGGTAWLWADPDCANAVDVL